LQHFYELVEVNGTGVGRIKLDSAKVSAEGTLLNRNGSHVLYKVKVASYGLGGGRQEPSQERAIQ
jgi:hypothetical protein